MAFTWAEEVETTSLVNTQVHVQIDRVEVLRDKYPVPKLKGTCNFFPHLQWPQKWRILSRLPVSSVCGPSRIHWGQDEEGV